MIVAESDVTLKDSLITLNQTCVLMKVFYSHSRISFPPYRCKCCGFLPRRSVESKTHKTTTDETGNGNGHNPREEEEANSLPVDGPEGAIAKTDTNGGTSDAHGGGDGERVLGEDENGDGGTHLHRGTSRGGVVGKLVTHN